MTFILNVLHKDFSLLAADRKGTAKGGGEIKFGNFIIRTKRDIEIHGIQKIYLSKNKNIAIGLAGNIKEHSYCTKINKCKNLDQLVSLIHKCMYNFLIIDNHEEILKHDSFNENSGIITYYETKTKEFFSIYYSFSYIHNFYNLHPREKIGGRLIHAGSGRTVFESAVGLDNIHKFCRSLSSLKEIPSYLNWMKDAYKKVSIEDEDSSEEMVGFVSTKINPYFIDINEYLDLSSFS